MSTGIPFFLVFKISWFSLQSPSACGLDAQLSATYHRPLLMLTVPRFITAFVGFPVCPQFFPCWMMQISTPAIDSVSCSVSVSAD